MGLPGDGPALPKVAGPPYGCRVRGARSESRRPISARRRAPAADAHTAQRARGMLREGQGPAQGPGRDARDSGRDDVPRDGIETRGDGLIPPRAPLRVVSASKPVAATIQGRKPSRVVD